MTARRSRFVHVELAKFISVPRAVIGSLGCVYCDIIGRLKQPVWKQRSKVYILRLSE